MSSKDLFGVILAGGVGTRFWPLSRETMPKQILKVAGDDSLLQGTIKRLSSIIPTKKISIVTNSEQAELIKLHLASEVKEKKSAQISADVGFIIEPFGRNTAPAIGLAALELIKKNPDAVMAVFPADHLIKNIPAFKRAISGAVIAAREGYLVTFGIKPSSPETGYGYIKSEKKGEKKYGSVNGRNIERFVEKPNLVRAKKYLKEGSYFWNSGIFIWKASVILEQLKVHTPSVYKGLKAINEGRDILKAYKLIESISIDNGVMEQAQRALVIEAPFGWSDVGSWASLDEAAKPNKEGNIIKGRVVDIGSEGSFIIGSDRVLATIGLKDIVVVDTPDATLVCPRNRAEEVKDMVGLLKKKDYVEHQRHVTIQRPWGTYTVLEEGVSYKIKKISVTPGKRLSLQSHKKRSEHWVVIKGQASITCGDEKIKLKKNESTYIPVGVKHRLENLSKTVPLEIIEVQNGSYLGEDDITRFDDDFKRS
ncbi:MAG: mannose-1-phosphate guanylyltransferase/mannose-6-phosphate isomerase [Deltaproteobacteria bacterium]|nr:mannose-1-phosphate guanylyltransferase/mannose-6-phosphate isomerase [Deltaproteobacteria bacterium]